MSNGRLALLFLLTAVTCDATEPPRCRTEAVTARPLASAPHVRSTDSVVLAALATGIAISNTFRHLLDRLDASDVIVHVERRQGRVRPSGYTQFIGATRHVRYLRITLTADEVSDAMVAILGHELRHAVETAEVPEVTDQSSYRELYRAIGRSSCGPPQWCFDTEAAVYAGARVHAELRGKRRSARPTPAQDHHRECQD